MSGEISPQGHCMSQKEAENGRTRTLTRQSSRVQCDRVLHVEKPEIIGEKIQTEQKTDRLNKSRRNQMRRYVMRSRCQAISVGFPSIILGETCQRERRWQGRGCNGEGAWGYGPHSNVWVPLPQTRYNRYVNYTFTRLICFFWAARLREIICHLNQKYNRCVCCNIKYKR